MKKYFITGATGTAGREVIHALLASNQAVVAASRSLEKSKRLFGGHVQHVFFDYADPSTFTQVTAADGIFVLGPPLDPHMYELVAPFIDYLQQYKHQKVVYLSANGMEELQELSFHADMEKKLKASSLEWCIVRPGFFMQNFGNYERENIEQRNLLFSPAGEGKTAFVSAKDIGSSVAQLLIKEGYSKQVFTLTGDELNSYFDVADKLSALLKRKIIYANPNEQTYRQVLKEGGAPDFLADYMLPVYRLIVNGKVENISSDVERLTGHKPEKLDSVLRRDFVK